MMNQLASPEYDSEDFLLTKIAAESPTFKSYLLGLLNDTDTEHPTNIAWMGTLKADGQPTQVTLNVTLDPANFVDED